MLLTIKSIQTLKALFGPNPYCVFIMTTPEGSDITVGLSFRMLDNVDEAWFPDLIASQVETKESLIRDTPYNPDTVIRGILDGSSQAAVVLVTTNSATIIYSEEYKSLHPDTESKEKEINL